MPFVARLRDGALFLFSPMEEKKHQFGPNLIREVNRSGASAQCESGKY